MYEIQPGEAFYNTLRFLQYLHYYPVGVGEKKLKYYHAVSVLIRVFSTFLFIQCCIHCIVTLKNKVPIDLSEDVSFLLGVANCMFVSIMFAVNTKRWSRLFYDVSNITKFGTPKNFTAIVKKANRYSYIYFIYCLMGISTYGMVKVLNTGSCERLNKEKGLHEICGTFTAMWWPNEDISPLSKTLIILYQLVSALYYIPSSAMGCFMVWEAAQILISKIHHLKDLFENAFDTKSEDSQIQRLKFCIKYHQEILRLADNLNKAGRRQCGQLSVIGAVIMSCIGSLLLKEYNFGALMYLMGYMLAIFILCQTGQNVMDEIYDIQDAVYASNWYGVSTKIAKDTQLILLRCQAPVCLEAVPFGIFNYSLFLIIIKTSYSYLTLISQTSD